MYPTDRGNDPTVAVTKRRESIVNVEERIWRFGSVEYRKLFQRGRWERERVVANRIFSIVFEERNSCAPRRHRREEFIDRRSFKRGLPNVSSYIDKLVLFEHHHPISHTPTSQPIVSIRRSNLAKTRHGHLSQLHSISRTMMDWTGKANFGRIVK
jgi:hypothetical protein